MPIFDLRCSSCRRVTPDVLMFGGQTIWDEDGKVVKQTQPEPVEPWVCPRCGGKKYKRLASNIGMVVIK